MNTSSREGRDTLTDLIATGSAPNSFGTKCSPDSTENVTRPSCTPASRPNMSSSARIAVASSAVLIWPRPERRLGHAVQVGVEAQVLLPRQVVVQGGVLEHQADIAPYGVALLDDVMTSDPGGTRSRVRQGAQDLDGGGLARPVRAEEAEGLSGG